MIVLPQTGRGPGPTVATGWTTVLISVPVTTVMVVKEVAVAIGVAAVRISYTVGTGRVVVLLLTPKHEQALLYLAVPEQADA